MNQDQVKEKLLALEEPSLEFSCVFSGKKSKRVNGLYKPETREIIIHNRNFEQGPVGDNLLIYTSIHEYAHHLYSCAHGGQIKGRSHNSEFWAIFHELLDKAEGNGTYHNTAAEAPELKALTEEIRKKFIEQNGELVKEFGQTLLKAKEICDKVGVRFEDYIDRVLRVPRQAANTAVRIAQLDMDPKLGEENMRFLASIRSDDAREAAEQVLEAGKSPDTARQAAKKASTKEPEDDKTRLEKEKARLERTIDTLTKRLEEVNEKLGED
jgi:hypothetical protein